MSVFASTTSLVVLSDAILEGRNGRHRSAAADLDVLGGDRRSALLDRVRLADDDGPFSSNLSLRRCSTRRRLGNGSDCTNSLRSWIAADDTDTDAEVIESELDVDTATPLLYLDLDRGRPASI